MKLWPRLLLLAALAAALPVLRAQEAKEDGQKEEAAEEKKEKNSEQSVLSDVPMGEPLTELRVPQRSPEGKLLSLFEAGVAKRIDEKHIEFTDLKIEIHNDDGTTFHVEMPHAVFDLDTRVLKSDTPAKISREGFVIDGDAVEFFTKTRFGRMTGNVKMVIESEDINE